MFFICYPKCSTCQKAKKWLDDHDIVYEERHIVESNPSYDELKLWYKNSGLELKRFFNTSGMLVKRPIIVHGDKVLVGFKEKDWLVELI